MYVCICNKVTDSQIKSAIRNGACTIGCLRQCLGVASQCGKCARLAKQMLRDSDRKCIQSASRAA